MSTLFGSFVERFARLRQGDWVERAACRGADPALFFPHDRGDHDNACQEGFACERVKLARARAICRGCPVRRECLAYALRSFQKEGVWGGTTPQERGRCRDVERLLARLDQLEIA